MSGLPSGWVEQPIKELVMLNQKHKGIEDDTECGFIPMALVPTQYLGTVSYEPRLWGACKKGYTHIKEGDVLLAKITPCFENGKSVLVGQLPNGIGAGSTEYFVLTVESDVLNSKYLHAFLKTKEFMMNCQVHMSGSVGHKRVPKDYLLGYSLPLAPIDEQVRIANKLDSLLAKVDKAQARLEKIPVQLKRFRQSVLAAATSGELTREWRGGNEHAWPLKVVGDVLASGPQNGLYKPSKLYGDGTAIIRIDGFYEGKVKDWKSFKKVQISEKELEKWLLNPNDILINRVNSIEYLGKCGLVEGLLGDTVFESNIMRISANSSILPEYLIVFFTSPIGIKRIRANAKHAVNQASINQTDVKSCEIEVPGIEEQQEIVRRVESLFALADSVEKQYQTAKARVDRLTQSILAKAFRGELVPQDPNDEPAAELLKRIQAEREAKPVKKTKRRSSAS